MDTGSHTSSPNLSPVAGPALVASVILESLTVPDACLNLLAVSADAWRRLDHENHFVFVNGMANGFYTFYNLPSYSKLPGALSTNQPRPHRRPTLNASRLNLFP